MTREEFIKFLDGKAHSFTKYELNEDGSIVIKGLDFYYNEPELPEGVNIIFLNEGTVSLSMIENIPGGIHFKNTENVILPSLEKIGEGTVFQNKGTVILDNIDMGMFSKGVRFDGGGSVIVWTSRFRLSDFAVPGGKISLNRLLSILIKQIYG